MADKEKTTEKVIVVPATICFEPLYVYGTYVATPPSYIKLGRGSTFNADANEDAGSDTSSFNPFSRVQETSTSASTSQSRRISKLRSILKKRSCYDSDKMADDAADASNCWEEEPYNACAPWMQTVDGRGGQDPGYVSYSHRNL